MELAGTMDDQTQEVQQRRVSCFLTEAPWSSRQRFPSPRPTSSRAELSAIILALEEALRKFCGDSSYKDLGLRIYSDSTYAVNSMEGWIGMWRRNGWTNLTGHAVPNRDLLEEAEDLDGSLRETGRVRYFVVPRREK